MALYTTYSNNHQTHSSGSNQHLFNDLDLIKLYLRSNASHNHHINRKGLFGLHILALLHPSCDQETMHSGASREKEKVYNVEREDEGDWATGNAVANGNNRD